MTAGDIREAEIIELLRVIDAEAEDRWTLLRVKLSTSALGHPAAVCIPRSAIRNRATTRPGPKGLAP